MQYIPWVLSECRQRGLTFRGAEVIAAAMARQKRAEDGDLFMDYGVSGNHLNRPGLDALLRRVRADRSVSHVFTPLRDRLARPNDPQDGVRLESLFRNDGVTLVFRDKVLPPLPPSWATC